ncbi:hypothetical protein [Pseudoalteromonas luteoviolacea]|uniref:hypothetical protein n=1 Tax=Pseudoalteromonas luteoviolacea TaxID=43657 RepID=UPI001B36743A|nr:hypothetical protein [Pseudoalteromonas luteoviolacea]MBQ4834731.1 hypothetical protein [Pseudoalteromonas luteoviolacea]
MVYDKTQNAVPSEATCILKAPCPNFVVSVTNYNGDPDLGDSIKVDAEKGPVEVIFDETRTFTLVPSYNLA